MKYSIEQFNQKLIMNSYYPIIGHANFAFYDSQIAKSVTSTSKTLMESLNSKLRK